MTDPTDPTLSAAVLLGWRVAELYSLADEPGTPSQDTLLPAHGSLEPADQLELHLRAAAGDARRAGVTSEGASLERLIGAAREAAASSAAVDAFRARLRCCHIEIAKDLWTLSEAHGRAYELGNGLSDTYGRICRAYRDGAASEAEAWRLVFDGGRVERLKKLLDDLQSRLDGTAVAVVRDQLDAWRERVQARLAAGAVPDVRRVRGGLRRQTVIWRQLVVGDKPPECYLDADDRARIRDTLRALLWRRYRPWLLPLVVALFGLALVLPAAVDWYQESLVRSGVASAALAAAGALGITQGSLLMTLRTRLHEWSALLWQRALVQEVTRVTLVVDEVLPPPPPEAHRIAGATARARRCLRASMVPRPAARTSGG